MLVGIENKQESLVSSAIGAITRHIREYDLMPGDRLPSEASMSQSLDVSRSVIREAFRSLAALKIIELSTGKRATVSPIDHGAMSLIMEHGVHTDQINIQQIYDVRRTVETRVVSLAAIRRTDAEAAAIMATAKSMRLAINESTKLMELDLEFHRQLGEASRNPVFFIIVCAFQGITRTTWPLGWKSRTEQRSREFMVNNHLEIAHAIRDGNPHAAVEKMAIHFDESVRALIAAGMS